jgi:hypothetical protein
MRELWRHRTTARWLNTLEKQRPRARAACAPGKAPWYQDKVVFAFRALVDCNDQDKVVTTKRKSIVKICLRTGHGVVTVRIFASTKQRKATDLVRNRSHHVQYLKLQP